MEQLLHDINDALTRLEKQVLAKKQAQAQEVQELKTRLKTSELSYLKLRSDTDSAILLIDKIIDKAERKS